jgi:GNAT superfamily N-acetyltransferase
MPENDSTMPATATAIDIRRVSGAEIRPYLEQVAGLRIAVFREWPYLYEGDMDYEREYLRYYASSPDSVFVIASDAGRIVGASTGLPLAHDQGAFQQPFVERGEDTGSVFYFGESVLLSTYRGIGIGHAFFDHREAHARALGRFATTAFCAVDRNPADPRRPIDYRDNSPFWCKRGYVRQPGLTVVLPWHEIDHGETAHTLTFWTHDLNQ